MKTIKLTQGFETQVDDENFDWLNSFTWRVSKQGNMLYAHTGDQRYGNFNSMHEMVLGMYPGFEVDHKDRNGLNNQKENLRHATHAQNNANKPAQVNNESGYKGVSWHIAAQKWIAQLTVNKQHHYLGLFDKKEDAALAYNAKAKKLLGEFAFQNEIKKTEFKYF